jgi:Circadian oscillating protein COP23
MKTLKLNPKSLVLIVASGSMLLLPTIAIPAPSYAVPKTTFACIRQNEVYVTVAIRGNRQTSPMITWKDNSHGANFTPEKRCKIVSQRLTKAVSQTNKLNSLTMTHGLVNSMPVICYIKRKGEVCNAKNILFSLKASERGQEQQILDNLLSFSTKGSGSSIQESAGTTDTVEDWIEKNLTTPVEDPYP